MTDVVCSDVSTHAYTPSRCDHHDIDVDIHDTVDKNTQVLLENDRHGNNVATDADADELPRSDEPDNSSDNVIPGKLGSDETHSAVGNNQSDKNIDREHSDTSEETEHRDADVTNKNSNSHYYRNREKILAYAKIRYRENREKLLAYSKQYQSERKDRVKERNDTYYIKNRDRLLRDRSEKITCSDCGKTITKGSLSGHLKTKYHLKRLEQNKPVEENTSHTSEDGDNKVVTAPSVTA
jgi:phage FluMu protein Com